MKRFKLSGNSANWNNGLRMSALNLATLTEEVSTPIPSDSRMFVSVANNIFHVDDARREVISGEITDADKNAILSRVKNDTPDFLLTLEDKVVGYACLHYRADGKRVNAPALDDFTKSQLTIVESNLAHGLIDVAEYNETKDEILSDFVAKIVKPTDGAVLLVAKVTPATPATPVHSFGKDGLTDTQKEMVYDTMRDFLGDIFDDYEAVAEIADALADDVYDDICQTADWESLEEDEICVDDVHIAIRRAMHYRLTA